MEPKFLPRPVKRSPLLPSESIEAYERDRSRIEEAIGPCDAIEQIYFEDFAYGRLQMQRLQRWDIATIKAKLTEAVYAVLGELNELENIDVNVVVQWCTDPVARATVSARLAKHGLDDSAIEAAAFRRCSRGLTVIDQLLTSHASRRDKSLQLLAFYREMKARQRQPSAKSAADHGGVARLDHKAPGSKKNGERTTAQG
jgi:hypothetical protein